MKTVTAAMLTALSLPVVPFVQLLHIFMPRFNTVMPGNSLLQSSAFGNASWTKTGGATVTVNTQISPSGATDACTLATSSAATGMIQIGSVASSTGQSFTTNIRVKRVATDITFGLATSSETNTAVFQFTGNGSGTPSLQSLVGFSSATASVVDEGNGWYTCSVSATSPATGQGNIGTVVKLVAAGSVHLWGAHNHTGSSAQDYIPTTSVAVYGDTIALNTSNRDVQYAGINFRGAYGLGSINQVEDSPGEIKGLSFQLSAASSVSVSLALDGADLWQGCPVNLYTTLLDTNFFPIDPTLEWSGFGDTLSLEETGANSILNATAESSAVDLLRSSVFTISDADQRTIDPTDRAFEYITSQVDKPVVWPSREWFIK